MLSQQRQWLNIAKTQQHKQKHMLKIAKNKFKIQIQIQIHQIFIVKYVAENYLTHTLLRLTS